MIDPIPLESVASGAGGFVIYGRDAYDGSGRSVASAGDINGDGFDDLIIGGKGAAGAGNSTPTSGESYVVFGHAGGFGASINLEDVAGGTGGFVIYGRDSYDVSGVSVASAGDVNGDGFDDLIIGAILADGASNSAAYSGESYVVFGHAGNFAASIDLDDVAAGTGGFAIYGREQYDLAGFSVASAGDIDGDGFDDVIVGAFRGGGASNSAGHPGASYVVFGHAGNFGASIDLDDIAAGTGGFVIYGREDGDRAGWSVDSAGDINGDGLDDLIIGAMTAYGAGNSTAQSGESYVVFGRAGGFGASVNLEDVAAGTGGFVIYGRDSYDISGVSAAGAGDINGDGFDDLIIGAMGAYGAGNATVRTGESYVVFGHAGAFAASVSLADVAAGTGGFVIYGRDQNDLSGSSVASAGDINGDGFDDLIIGADGGAGARNATAGTGESYVLFGRADFTLPIATNDTATLMENALPTSIGVLANDSAAATLQGIGQMVVVSTVAAITAADVMVAIQNQKITVTPGDDFAKLAAGQNATITIPYTIRNNAGATATATLTITVTGQQGTVGNDQINLTGIAGGVAAGGKGNDTYLVDDPADTPVELVGQGTDTVRASLSWSLGTTLENLVLTGMSALNGTGNTANNVLTGNGGANRLDGGAGADTISGGAGKDTLVGGSGNDTYVVGAGDRVTELSAGGIDTVKSAIGWTLAANVENLVITGTGAVIGTGNTLANALTGNGAANTLAGLGGADTLLGGGGNDVLKGGAGNDKLTGGAGADAFVFETALGASTNKDTVVDFLVGTDKLRLDDDVFTKLGGAGALAAAAFHSAAGATAAHDADDRLIYNTTTGVLYYDADGKGGSAAVAFAVLGATTHPVITADDFLIVS